MTSFSIIRGNGSVPWTAERLDINLWALPTLLGQQTYYCDLGICAVLGREPSASQELSFDLRLPFATDFAEVQDLIPLMRNDDALLSLVFGTGDLHARSDQNGRWIKDEPNKGDLLLVSLDIAKCVPARSSHPDHSQWSIHSADLEGVPNGARIYMRLRFVTHSPRRLWEWQKSGRWNSHAICDLRVNDFRQSGTDVDFAKLARFERVNAFVIASANYKAGRISPAPKYVRILEPSVWGPYLRRPLSRSREMFIITYWRRADDADAVDQDHPFRAFLELDRRRPTAAKSTAIGVAVLTVIAVSLQTPAALLASIAGQVVQNFYAYIAGALTIPVVFSVAQWLFRRLSRANFDAAKKALAWLEKKRYALSS